MEEKKIIYADELLELMREYDISYPLIDDYGNYYGSRTKSIEVIWNDLINMIEQSNHIL